jgi:hypothetical protein
MTSQSVLNRLQGFDANGTYLSQNHRHCERSEAKQSFCLSSSIWGLPRRWRSFMPFGYLCPLGIYALWVFMPFGYLGPVGLAMTAVLVLSKWHLALIPV